MPHPWADLLRQMPHPGEDKAVKCPTNARGGGAGECALGIDGAITSSKRTLGDIQGTLFFGPEGIP